MLNQHTLAKLRDMKLLGMAAAFERQLAQPQSYDIGFEERFGMLVDAERTSRDDKRLQRLLRNARFKFPQACIEDIKYEPQRGLDKGQIAGLAGCDWVRARQRLIITGATGVGKTWIACAFGQAAARQGLSVVYKRMPPLFEDLKVAHGDGSFSKRIRQLAGADLLILDDWGIKILSTQERHDLLEIIEERHHRCALIIAGQVPIDRWHDFIGNPTIADAILDRVLEQAHRLHIKGESMRKSA
jgi:DNA replication protein DnaC